MSLLLPLLLVGGLVLLYFAYQGQGIKLPLNTGMLPLLTPVQAQPTPALVNTLPPSPSATGLPSASSVHQTESMMVPATVKTFVIYAANELHEDIKSEAHKLISDKNPYFVPKSLSIASGTSVVIHNADAPWDSPHPHNFVIGSQKASPKLPWAANTQEFRLPAGTHKVTATDSPWAVGSVQVRPESASISNVTAGAFYTPTKQVSNPKDNSGGMHQGNLAYYMQEFPRNGLKIESVHNFSFASCSYCPGKYWPDNKSADQTLIIWSSTQPLPNILAALTKLTKENVYI